MDIPERKEKKEPSNTPNIRLEFRICGDRRISARQGGN